MRILLLDETSAAERLSSDQNKNANIGLGVGSARLSEATTPFANASAQLASGRCVPLSVLPGSGVVTLPWYDRTTQPDGNPSIISTGRGRAVYACTEGQGDIQEADSDGSGGCLGVVTVLLPDFGIGDIQTNGDFTVSRGSNYQSPDCSPGGGDASSLYAYI